MPFKKGHKSFLTAESKRKISLAQKGRKQSPELIEKRIAPLRGRKKPFMKRRPMSEVTKDRIRQRHIGRKIYWADKISKTLTGRPNHHKGVPSQHKGAKSHLWRGGIAPINKQIRYSPEGKRWRKEVLLRDKVCIWCGSDKELQVDHIKPFAKYPNLRFDVSNGRVLCFSCHRKTPTYSHRHE